MYSYLPICTKKKNKIIKKNLYNTHLYDMLIWHAHRLGYKAKKFIIRRRRLPTLPQSKNFSSSSRSSIFVVVVGWYIQLYTYYIWIIFIRTNRYIRQNEKYNYIRDRYINDSYINTAHRRLLLQIYRYVYKSGAGGCLIACNKLFHFLYVIYIFIPISTKC